MSSELSICTMKWKPLPTTKSSGKMSLHRRHSTDMVNGLFYDLKRQLNIPFQFICITDNPNGLDDRIFTVPLPKKLKNMHHGWPKTYLHSEEMKAIAGDRFAYFDMDAVITGDLSETLSMNNEIIITRFNDDNGLWKCKKKRRSRLNSLYLCNTCFYLMDTGCCNWVWEEFDLQLGQIEHSQNKPDYLKPYKGTDQGWVSYQLHDNFENGDILTVSPDEGFYEFKQIADRRNLPEDAKVVFFGGKDHPYDTKTREKSPWIKEYRPL